MAQMSLQTYLSNETVKTRLNERFGKNASALMSAVLSVYSSNKQLQECDPKSIMGAAALAQVMNLPIAPGLNQAYIMPYRGKATFVVGYKGLIQLAHRSGQYVRLHAGVVREGEFRGFDALTGEPIGGEAVSDEIVGYVAYFKLVNGFEKYEYMSVEQMDAHAQKYSQSYGKSYSPWSTNFEDMARKTVLKRLLSRWGVLTPELQEAMRADQSLVDKNTYTYVDNGGNVVERNEIPIDEETGEIVDVDLEAQA